MGRISNFEVWINKNKKGSKEDFLKDYPEAKRHMMDLDHNISVLICNNKIWHRANDKFEWIGS